MNDPSLQERNQILRELGYIESKRKPFLFYQKIHVKNNQNHSKFIFFADMRISYYANLFSTDLPLCYSMSDESLPSWLVNRTEKLELEKLIQEGIAPTVRKDWISIEYDCFTEYWKWMKDGFCRDCGSDIQNNEYLCKECNRTRLNKIIAKLPHCKACRTKIAKGVLNTKYVDECNGIWYQFTHFTKDSLIADSVSHGFQEVRSWAAHHIDYANNITVFVCTFCHSKITAKKDPKYKKWWPKDKRPKERISKLVPCKQCDGKARVHIDNIEEANLDYSTEVFGTEVRLIQSSLFEDNNSEPTSLCSKCKRVNEREFEKQLKEKKGQRCRLCDKKIKYNPYRPYCYNCYSGSP
ncbi:MAG: hypothetical protein P1Q69_03300 [Candidatus Thorarchaeota archaeon]|nr:hypothetical protein [Candidatus Thorarchaeota archaeon]